MLQTTSTPGTVMLDPREVAALAWRPFAGISGLRDRVLWQDPAGKSLAGLLHLDPDARVLAHIHLRATHHLWVVAGSCTIDGQILDAGSYGLSRPAGCTASSRWDGPAASCSTCTCPRAHPGRRPPPPTGASQR
jgi:hypothetical protein